MSTSLQPPVYPGWQTVNAIGRGSFGTVYEIQRDLYGDTEKAALKVISLPYNDSDIDDLRCSGMTDDSILQSIHAQVRDIAREYKLMAQIRSCPNVVRCDDFMEVPHKDRLGWDIYIKMELLTPLLKRPEQTRSEQQIIRLGKDLCRALIACQERNIIHRDIKPSNIFISGHGEFKLGDFGIARTLDRTTNATAGIGTYAYMAPEIFSGQTYGKTADIYSLGLVLYWCLNEHRGPFVPLPPAIPSSKASEEAKDRRLSGEPLPPPKNGSSLLKRIVLRACAFQPKDRYQTATQMLEALETLEKQQLYPDRSAKDALLGSLWEEKLAHSKNQFLSAVGSSEVYPVDNTHRVRPAGTNTPPPQPLPDPPVYEQDRDRPGNARGFWLVAVVFLLSVFLFLLLLIPTILNQQEQERGSIITGGLVNAEHTILSSNIKFDCSYFGGLK